MKGNGLFSSGLGYHEPIRINGQFHAPTACTPRRDANVYDLRWWVRLENYYGRLLAIRTIPTNSYHQICSYRPLLYWLMMGYEYHIKLTSVCGYLAIGQQFPTEPASTVSSMKSPKWLLQVQRTQSWNTSTDISQISGPTTPAVPPLLPSIYLRGVHDYGQI